MSSSKTTLSRCAGVCTDALCPLVRRWRHGGRLLSARAKKSTAWMTAVSCHARHALILSRAVAQVRAGQYELYYSE